jgi:putative aldouronate transport system permease protein
VSRSLEREGLFDLVNLTILVVAAVICVYPLWFVVVASFSAPRAVASGLVILLPREITFEGYREVLKYAPLWRGYLNTVLYTVLGTLINVLCTLSGGYALSREELPARRLMTFLFAFTLIFNPGLIPRYLLVRNLGLLNRLWSCPTR